jgi:mono/diheme cytochrome c family protein
MKAVVTVIAGLVLASGLSVAAAGNPSAPVPQDAKVAAGKKAYEANKCSTCHKIAGVGKMSALDGVGSKLSAAEIKQWLVDPKSMEAKLATKPKISMKNYKALPAEELDALVAYMLSLKK